MTPSPLAHDDVARVVVDYDADADFWAEGFVCHVCEISLYEEFITMLCMTWKSASGVLMLKP